MAALPASFLPCSERRSIRSAEHSRIFLPKNPILSVVQVYVICNKKEKQTQRSAGSK